jgi:hypothetical protein
MATHISPDSSNTNQYALTNTNNRKTKAHGQLTTSKEQSSSKNYDIKHKKLSSRSVDINHKGVIEIYDTLLKEFLERKQEEVPVLTRHVQKHDNYC